VIEAAAFLRALARNTFEWIFDLRAIRVGDTRFEARRHDSCGSGQNVHGFLTENNSGDTSANGGQQHGDADALELSHCAAVKVCHPEIGTIERYAYRTGRSSHVKSSECDTITSA